MTHSTRYWRAASVSLIEPTPARHPMDTHNPNCDGSHCASSTGEVRVLPTGPQSNAILCRTCFAYEVAWRRECNKAIALSAQFALPEWSSLAVYRGDA